MGRDFSISFPYQQDRVPCFLCGLFFGGVGLWCLSILSVPDWETKILAALILGPYGLGLGFLGFRWTLKALVMVHLVPEGIAVTMLGKHLRLYPKEQIAAGYVFLADGSSVTSRICITDQTPQQLIELRAAAIRRKRNGEKTLIYRKSRAGWKDWFLRDQLKRMRLHGFFNAFCRNTLWMEFTPERQVLLSTLYPNRIWHWTGKLPESRSNLWKDMLPDAFCRGRCHTKDRLGAKALCSMFTLPFAGAFALQPLLGEDGWVALFITGLTAAGFWLLWLAGRKEYDLFQVSSEGIRILRQKKQLTFLPSGQIRTILRGNCRTKGGVETLLAVTDLTERELAERIRNRYRHCRDKSLLLHGFCQIPGGEKLVINWMLSRTMNNLAIFRIPYIYAVSHTVQREQLLRKQYPNAQWLDLCWETLMQGNNFEKGKSL